MCEIFWCCYKITPRLFKSKAHSALVSLEHRGPDQHHYEWIHNDRHVIFVGTQRLRITGGNEGVQPLYSANGEWIVQLNGGIIIKHYNDNAYLMALFYKQLRYSSHCRIVRMHSFTQVLSQLRGMFALSIIHVPTSTIWLYQDRMGVKPLYWYWNSSKKN